MASVEVESAANIMPEKVELTTPEATKEVEPVVAAPEPVLVEVKEETTIDTPPPVEEPAATPQVMVEAATDVVEEPNIKVEESKAETNQAEVKTTEEALVKEETPVTKEGVPEVTKEDTPVAEEAKEAVKEGEVPTEVVATIEVATEE